MFLTSVFKAVAGDRADGEWLVDGSEEFLRGHFPGDPIVPGVLITEAMAQIAGVAMLCGRRDVRATLAHIDVRFRELVRPPAAIRLSARCQRSIGGVYLVEVDARVESSVVAHGQVALSTSEPTQVDEDLK